MNLSPIVLEFLNILPSRKHQPHQPHQPHQHHQPHRHHRHHCHHDKHWSTGIEGSFGDYFPIVPMWRKMIRLDYWHVCLIRRAVSKGCDFTGCHTLCARKPNVWRSGDCTGIGYTKTCSYMFIYCIGMYSWSTKETFGGERYCSNVSLGFHFLRESAEQSFRLQGLCNVCIDIVDLSHRMCRHKPITRMRRASLIGQS